MITAVKELGEILLESERKEPLDILIENPDSKGTYKIAWILEFDNELNFIDVVEEELKAEEYKIYLYKRGSGSNSPDFSPTSRVTKPEITFTRKIIRWFENHKHMPECEKILSELQNNKDYILGKLKELNSQSKDDKILTLKIDGNYLYNISLFRRILLEDFFSKIKEVSKENAICSICGNRKELVFATSQLYKFFTTDKECYIAGGFNKKEAWKNFPICEECFLKADYGRKYIESNLKFKFYSKTYYLIPRLILNTHEALKEISEVLSYNKTDIQKLSKSEKKKYFADRDEILDIVKDHKDIISFYFLFQKGGGKGDKDQIVLLIEDVLPSRIHRIFEVKEVVESLFNIDNYTFEKINKFIMEFDKLLFELIDMIFKGGSLNYHTLIELFMKKIRQSFNNNEDFNNIVKDALMNIVFLKELELLDFKEGDMEDLKFEEMFKKLGGALNTPAKKGIFLLGALTQMLLKIQEDTREGTPFLKQLKGLKMNEGDIKGLVPKVVNKLKEYGKFSYKEQVILEEIYKYLLREENYRLTVDEINFYFVAGMSLYKDVEKAIFVKNSKEV